MFGIYKQDSPSAFRKCWWLARFIAPYESPVEELTLEVLE